ncbi:MAG TPA: protein kinase [Longimicrobiales bacterium]|nr:protein kinase [Longimicrobiales bacterium]
MAVGSDSPPLAGRYALERMLGQGGMGMVYLARDLKYDRLVAVKFLSDEPARAVSGERFLREIRTTARLNHAHILSVHDSGEIDGQLYYVMPHVEGASLRERIDRTSRLPVREALRIASEAASALSYAHAHGIIHRDIKPDNILLDPEGHVYVADFGLAHALSAVDSSRLTQQGLVVGSPAYMSPEQAGGEQVVDGRSDLYSLGCVLYEMLVGEPPFPGKSAHATLHSHLTEPPPSLRSRRADVPPSLEGLLARLLAKAPESRYPTADALVRALGTEIARAADPRPTASGETVRSRRRRLGLGLAAAGVATALVAGIWETRTNGLRSRLFAPPLDSMTYAVLPLHWETPVSDAERDDAVLHAGLARWSDLNVMPALRVMDAAARYGAAGLTSDEALRVARVLGAGRYIHGRATAFGESIQIDVALHDATADGASRRRVTLRVPRADPRAAALIIDSLLFGRVTWDGESLPEIGTSSGIARRLYGQAHEALRDWNLAGADSLFGAAAEHDPGFARAHLWLAQTRNWAGEPPVRWRSPAERASQDTAWLTSRERLLAEGLVALARERFTEACAAYGRLIEPSSRDFAGLYGLGECRRRDNVVVRDRTSPSGWRFRSSPHAAVEAYAGAYRALPASFNGIDGSASDRFLAMLFTHANIRRDGRAADGRGFTALPAWQGDTLALVPYPLDQDASPPARAWNRALLQHRHLYHEVARLWASTFPSDADALYALALSLEMLGDPAALDMVGRARALATDPSQQLRLGIREVWMRVKFGTPDRLDELVQARNLADSLLVWEPGASGSIDRQLGSLALLLGRPAAAARYARSDASEGVGAVPGRAAASLLAFAAAGGPVDSIVAHERQVEHSIRSSIPIDDQSRARSELMEQAGFLAFPVHRLSVIASGESLHSPIARAQSSFSDGAPAVALAILTATRDARADFPHEEISLDVLYAEAALLALLGDTTRAAAWLDPVLAALPSVQPGKLEDVARTGGLVRAMALRAELAHRSGNSATAARWARAAATLWARGEAGTRPTLERMRQIAGRSSQETR